MPNTRAAPVEIAFMGDRIQPACQFWTERVKRERKVLHKHWLRQDGQEPPFAYDMESAPLHEVHQTSIAGLLRQTSSTPVLPPITSPDVNNPRQTAYTASERTATASRLPSRASVAKSRRSGASRISAESLRREVQDAVEQEVMKVVAPLQEQIRTELTKRERLEAMLEKAEGTKAPVRLYPPR
mmetsp:Transcript_59899/g.110951  ORF Transcript_59899/g.110951 Transcript_59899/m.110951 type:complete len:184 (+) Transcript_59899:102-653(+)